VLIKNYFNVNFLRNVQKQLRLFRKMENGGAIKNPLRLRKRVALFMVTG